MPEIDDTVVLDARGLICPLPVLKARKLLKGIAAGEALRVLVTDPGAPKDFEHFCKVTGATMIDCREEADGVIVFTMRKPA